MAFMAKTMVLFTPATCTAMPTGTNTKSMLSHVENRISLQASKKRLVMFGLSSVFLTVMEVDASPLRALSGGGAGGGKLDSAFSATSLLVELVEVAPSFDETPEIGGPAGKPAFLEMGRLGGLSKELAER